MKKRRSLFLSSFIITFTIILCMFIFVYGIFASFESIQKIGFGKTKTAVQIIDGGIRVLDFYIKF